MNRAAHVAAQEMGMNGSEHAQEMVLNCAVRGGQQLLHGYDDEYLHIVVAMLMMIPPPSFIIRMIIR